jgi:putative hemolysin
MGPFQVKLAENSSEVAAAQRLRFEVFNIEMKKGLASSYVTGLDCDAFDPLCDHILIIDTKTNQTIGTYRLLLGSRLGPSGRFYSENEFDLMNIKKLKGEIMEMGRSCVHKDYRRNAIVYLLWNKIIEYLRYHQVCYIIGCPSVYETDPEHISRIYTLMKEKYFAPQAFRVYPKKGLGLPELKDHVDIAGQEKKIFLQLPSLLRSYLKTGAFVCGEPSLDGEFGTVDFFMCLEVKNISKGYLSRLRVGEDF